MRQRTEKVTSFANRKLDLVHYFVYEEKFRDRCEDVASDFIQNIFVTNELSNVPCADVMAIVIKVMLRNRLYVISHCTH